MELKLTNTLSGKVETFEAIDSKNVRMYVCGPTVYDNPHIGNARPLVVYDVLYRLLKYIYGDDSVKFVRNITDVDDKIIARAKEIGINPHELTENIINEFHKDCAYLGCLAPDFEPKVTETINEIIKLVEILISSGSAYVSDGNVYFRTKSFKDYGKLAGRDLEKLIAGARVDLDLLKESPEDFVLWKNSNEECSYNSPWGYGRPGWHIECSAMSNKFLGENFDIHGGGADLMFPHHTNEIAQSCSAYPGSFYAKYWVHNGFVTINGQKMSKSLGNFKTISDFRNNNIEGEVIRFLLLNTHYRSPLDFSDKAIYDAKENLNYLYRAIEPYNPKISDDLDQRFLKFLLEDLNTHNALSFMLELAKDVNKNKSENDASLLFNCGRFLGFFSSSVDNWFGREDSIWVEALIEKRLEAKKSKNWTIADQIRNELISKGIIIEDKPDGTTSWRKS